MSHTLIPPHQTSARGVFLKFAFVLDDPLNSIYVVPPVHKKHLYLRPDSFREKHQISKIWQQ